MNALGILLTNANRFIADKPNLAATVTAFCQCDDGVFIIFYTVYGETNKVY